MFRFVGTNSKSAREGSDRGAPHPSAAPRAARPSVGERASSADAHRRLRARAVLRPVGVRGQARPVRERRRGLVDGRAARAGRRRDARDVGRPEARLHRVDRPPAAAAGDRDAVRLDRVGRRARVRGRRGGDLLPPVDLAPGGQPRHRHVARLPVAVRGRARRRGDREPARAARGGRLVARCRSADPVVPARDADGRRQRAAQPDGHAADGGGVAASRLRVRRRPGSGSSPTRSTASSSTTAPRPCPPAPTSTSGPSRSASCRSRSRWPGCASAGWRREIGRCSIDAPG